MLPFVVVFNATAATASFFPFSFTNSSYATTASTFLSIIFISTTAVAYSLSCYLFSIAIVTTYCFSYATAATSCLFSFICSLMQLLLLLLFLLGLSILLQLLLFIVILFLMLLIFVLVVVVVVIVAMLL